MAEYKNVGLHPYDLASGQMLGPGETAELDKDAVKDPHNAALIDDGILIELEAEKKTTSAKTKGGSDE